MNMIEELTETVRFRHEHTKQGTWKVFDKPKHDDSLIHIPCLHLIPHETTDDELEGEIWYKDYVGDWERMPADHWSYSGKKVKYRIGGEWKEFKDMFEFSDYLDHVPQQTFREALKDLKKSTKDFCEGMLTNLRKAALIVIGVSLFIAVVFGPIVLGTSLIMFEGVEPLISDLNDWGKALTALFVFMPSIILSTLLWWAVLFLIHRTTGIDTKIFRWFKLKFKTPVLLGSKESPTDKDKTDD